MTETRTATFDVFVDDLRYAIGVADAVNDDELHSFKKLAAGFDYVIPEQWLWDAYEELDAQGHLHAASGLTFGDAHGRLSADGRLYLRELDEDAW